MKLFGISGWSGAGKTTLIRKLIAAFTARGLAVGTIKHSHHLLDFAGAEADALLAAGAGEIVLASPSRWALLQACPDEARPGVADLAARMAGLDLLLVEGFKYSRHPRLEVWDEALAKPPLAVTDHSVLAVVSDDPVSGPGHEVARFRRDDIEMIASFIEKNSIPLSEYPR